MSNTDRLYQLTVAEIEKACPDNRAYNWFSTGAPEMSEAIDQARGKVERFRKSGNIALLKKVLRIWYKLHLEGFRRYAEANPNAGNKTDPAQPGEQVELTQADIDSFKELGIEANFTCFAGDFMLVPEYTGRTDRVEITPEGLAKIVMIKNAFPGSRIVRIGKAIEEQSSTSDGGVENPPVKIPRTGSGQSLSKKSTTSLPARKSTKTVAESPIPKTINQKRQTNMFGGSNDA
jgi:hypothetical protein